MSYHEVAFDLETLNHENVQLLQHIDYLEERLSHYENVPTLEETSQIAQNEQSAMPAPLTDQWNIWPYSWATMAWHTTTKRFHSFHGRLQVARTTKVPLSEATRRRRGFSQAHRDEGELTLT